MAIMHGRNVPLDGILILHRRLYYLILFSETCYVSFIEVISTELIKVL